MQTALINHNKKQARNIALILLGLILVTSSVLFLTYFKQNAYRPLNPIENGIITEGVLRPRVVTKVVGVDSQGKSIIRTNKEMWVNYNNGKRVVSKRVRNYDENSSRVRVIYNDKGEFSLISRYKYNWTLIYFAFCILLSTGCAVSCFGLVKYRSAKRAALSHKNIELQANAVNEETTIDSNTNVVV